MTIKYVLGEAPPVVTGTYGRLCKRVAEAVYADKRYAGNTSVYLTLFLEYMDTINRDYGVKIHFVKSPHGLGVDYMSSLIEFQDEASMLQYVLAI